ncbi:MAG: MBL fold metallo-hydrolase [Deltaproteobacteria bacterium]|nr:MBL fold metallo-hydrolase [Deltaproteobacteria bacterium]MBW2446495.1 MBL fold metallo-hydrolase [Deltaproteobacteria bacterium]
MRTRLACSFVLAALLAPAADVAAAEGVRVRWLGVAGFAVEAGDDTILHDPYLSRPGALRTFFRPYVPDATILEPLLASDGPAPEVGRGDLILIGHSHFDHLADAPWIADRTGATVVGSETTVAISRGFGLAKAQLRRADPGDRLSHGAFDVRVVESRHMTLPTGSPPAPGVVTEPPAWPMPAVDFRLGDARGYLVTHRPSGLRLFFLSSAGLHRPAIEALKNEGVRADVLLISTSGRTDDFVHTLLDALRPRIVVPQHYDNFFVPLADPDAAVPIDEADLAAFEAEVASAARELDLAVEVRRPRLLEAVSYP